MTIPEAEALGYVVATRVIDVEGTPPKVAVVTLRRGTTAAPWLAVEQSLAGTGLGGLPAVLDVLVTRINEAIPAEPEPEEYVDRVGELETKVADLEARLSALEGSG